MSLKQIYLITIIFVTALGLGCSKAGDGFAPGGNTILTPPDAFIGDSTFKYGSEIKTPAGWVVQMDQTDPVQASTTVSGWTVEVKYE